MKGNHCARLLAFVTGLVNQQLLLQNEYLAAENRILKARLPSGWWLSDGERVTLAQIGRRLGRKGLQPVARIAKPDTILAGIANWWPRNLTAPNSAARPAGRASVERLRIWWFAWLARTPGGVTTGLWERWPTCGIKCPTRPWAISCVGMESPLCRSGAKRPPGRTSFAPAGVGADGADGHGRRTASLARRRAGPPRCFTARRPR